MAEQTGPARPTARQRVAHLIWGTGLLPSPVRDGLRDAYRAGRRAQELWRMRQAAARMPAPPTIRLVVPVAPGEAGEGSMADLRATATSVRRQVYGRWELVVVADGPGPVPRAVAAALGTRDSRMRLWPGPAVERPNAALSAALVAPGADLVAVIEPGDRLARQALFRVAEACQAEPGVGVVYTDERIGGAGAAGAESDGSVYKPDWSPEHALAAAYTGRLTAYRRERVAGAGGLDEAYTAGREYDLLLRLVERGATVRHVSDVVYSRRPGAPPALPGEEAARVVAAHLRRTGAAADVLRGEGGAPHRVRYHVRGDPRVSIVIPTAGYTRPVRGQPTNLLVNTVRSIAERTDYGDYEIVYVYNQQLPPETLEALAATGVELRGVPYDRPFNCAEKINDGAAVATGQHLLLLNDDVEVINAEWLRAMVEYSQQPGIGAVGALLYFEDGSVQHAGVTVAQGRPGHPFRGFSPERQARTAELGLVRNYSAVTGACVMSRTEVFREVGGFRTSFPVNWNDVDYCLKLRALEYRVVYTPHARLFHFESISRSVSDYVAVQPEERALFDRLWADVVERDPYHDARRAGIW